SPAPAASSLRLSIVVPAPYAVLMAVVRALGGRWRRSDTSGQTDGLPGCAVPSPVATRCAAASSRARARARRAGPYQPHAHRAMQKEPFSVVVVVWAWGIGSDT
ncbi:hypothetical protein ADK38_00905, partial [Streptomyces varsoviensis]